MNNKKWLSFYVIAITALLLFSCEVTTDGATKSNTALSTGEAWDGSQTPRTAQDMSKPIVMGYYPSWSLGYILADGVSSLSLLPDHVTHVIFSFAKANLRYTKGSYDVSTEATGIQSFGGKRLALSIELLRRRGTKVILSLGGMTYWGQPENYTDIHYDEIKDLVDDFGFDGIDWDYEPHGGFDYLAIAKYRDYMVDFIRESRKVMPKSDHYLIMATPPGVGALGGSINDDPDPDFPYKHANRVTWGPPDAQGGTSLKASGLFNFGSTGSMIPIMAAVDPDTGETIGSYLDLIAYQSYNSGPANLDGGRMVMYDSWLYYAEKYGFALAHGTHVPPEPWDNLFVHTPRIEAKMAQYVATSNKAKNRADGIMIWQLFMSSNNNHHNGISYLKIAADFLNGADYDSYDFGSIDYGEGVDLGTGPVVVGEPATSADPENSNLEAIPSIYIPPNDGEIRPYDANAQYPIAGYLVSYKGKIYKNGWWSQGDIPGEIEAATGGPNPWILVVDATTNSDVSSSLPSINDEIQAEASTAVKDELDKNIQGEYPDWEQGKVYSRYGFIVRYNNKYYKLRYWSRFVTPDNSAGLTPTSDFPWELMKDKFNVPYTTYNPPVQDLTETEMLSLSMAESPLLDKIREKEAAAATGTKSKDPASPTTWDSTVAYEEEGYYVTYNGRTYKSLWYVSPGIVPGSSAWNGWKEEDSDGSSALKPGKSNITPWDPNKVYPGKSYYVTHQGNTYVSRWYTNPGQEPGNSDPWKLVN